MKERGHFFLRMCRRKVDISTLHKALLEKGILASVQGGPSLRNVLAGIDHDDRIVCAQREDEHGLYGPSFWLYGKNDTWYLGFWSGDVFRIRSCDSIVQMAAELIVDMREKSTNWPTDGLTDKYGLDQWPV